MLFQKKGVVFSPASFAETEEMIKNPGRGFYEIHTFVLGEPWDLENLRWCVKETHTVALVLLDIRAARDREITPQELTAVDALLGAFADLEVELILRVVYDREGKGLQNEPAFLSRIMGHMKQLAPVIRVHSPHILLLQGLLVGSWGEMHTSKFLQPASVRQLAEIWMNETGCKLAVRTPGFMRILEEEGANAIEKPIGKAIDKSIALYNDGLFGSETDLGTYEDRERDLQYLQENVRYRLNGGEAVCGAVYPTAAEVVDRMKRMHIAYLNSVHDKRLLEYFRTLSYGARTLYDYLESHMGYRFAVRGVTAKAIRGSQEIQLKIRVENAGFGNLCQEAEALLVLEGEEGKRELPLETDPRSWDAGDTVTLSADISDPENARVYLSLRRRADGKALRFANQGQKEGLAVLGNLAVPHSRKQ